MEGDFEMDESDLLFGDNDGSDCDDDNQRIDDDDDDDGTASGSDSADDLTDHVSSRRADASMAGLAIPTRRGFHAAPDVPSTPSLMRSRSMPNTAKFMSSNEQKWRVKYLSALKLQSTAMAAGDESQSTTAPSPVLNNIPRHSRTTGMSPSVRGVRTRKMSSDPIVIPTHQALSQSLSGIQQLDWRKLESSERYQRNLNQYEQDRHRRNEVFVPPHEMVQRDCFSLGMKHHFKPKQGHI